MTPKSRNSRVYRKFLHALVSGVAICALVLSSVWFLSASPATAQAVSLNSLPAQAVPAGDIVGTPWTGEQGVSETTAQIMERQRIASLQPRKAAPQVRPFRTSPKSQEQDTISPVKVQAEQSSGVNPNSPQTPAFSFTASTLADKSLFPPDTMGAVGPTQFIVAVNNVFRTINKTTGIADSFLNADPDVFFQPVETPPTSSNFTSDPHIRYDRITKQWFIVMIDVPGGQGQLANRVMLAVSDAASQGVITGSTVWTEFFFQQNTVSPAGDNNKFADYPTLGIDNNALYIGVNLFNTTSPFNFFNTTGFVVRKSSITGAGPIVVSAFRDLITGSTPRGPFTPQGVDNLDSTSTEGYFIGADAKVFNRLDVLRISNPGGTPSISGNLAITGLNTKNPFTVPHKDNTGGTNGNLDSLDDRLFAAVIRNGHLWTAHNIGVDHTGAATTSTTDHRDAARWYDITNLTTTPTLNQFGTVYDTNATADINQLNYWIPTIMVSGQGHAAMGFSVAGTNAYANAATVGRLASDPLNTMETVVNYTSNSFAYNPALDTGAGNGSRRWGDYSYTSLDPTDDMTMWTIQEFTSSTDNYGTRVAKLLAPPPATPMAGQAAYPNQTADIAVFGTSTAGSGFYNPDASFTNHIAVSISGGSPGDFTVNSVTYTDPTHISFNLTTGSSVAPGNYTFTVTNPDGQTSTGTLQVLAANGINKLSVSNASLSFNSSNLSQQNSTLFATGRDVNWTSSTSYANGNNWLSFTPSSGLLLAGNSTSIGFVANPTGLAAGTYNATVTFQDANDASNSVAVNVALVVSNYTYYLPYLANNAAGFTSYVAVQNIGNGSATISAQFYDQNGHSVNVQSAACSQLAANAECSGFNPFAAGGQGTGVIVSNQPLAVIVAESTPFGSSAYAVGAGAASSLVAPLAINNSLNFNTQLNVANVGANATTVTVSFYDQSGNLVAGATKTLNLAAHAVTKLDQTAADSGLAAGFYGWAKIDGAVGQLW